MNENEETSNVKVRKIEIEGLKRIHHSVVNNEMNSLYKVRDLNELRNNLMESMGNLRNIGVFDDINVKVVGAEGDISASAVDVHIQVKESRIGQMKLGTFLEDGEATFEASGLLRSPFGGGEKFEASASVGNERSNAFNLIYSKPRFFGSRWNIQSGLREYSKNHQWASSHDERVRGFHAHLKNPETSLEFIYSVDWRDIIPTKGKNPFQYHASKEVIDMAIPSLKSSIGVVYKVDHRDNPIIPSQGSLVEVSSELAGLGGSISFAKSEFTLQHFVELIGNKSSDENGQAQKHIPGLVVGATVKTGVLYPFDRIPILSDMIFGKPTKHENRHHKQPTSLINDRFFLGGPMTFRGFNYRGAGPAKSIGKGAKMDSIGGDIRWSAGLSAHFPIPFRELAAGGVRLHIFGNIGGLCGWKDISKDELFGNGARVAVGVGVVIPTPMGRMEVNYSVPLQFNKNGDDTRRIQIGVGLDFL